MADSVPVTIGLPFRNNKKTLRAAIQSIFSQTFQEWELLLVDDGSTDGSLELAEQIRDPRVKVFADGRPKGLTNRLNEIIERASGEYLARMDGDDLMHPCRLERQLCHLRRHPEVDLVGTRAILIDAGDRPFGVTGDMRIDMDPKVFLQRSQLIHPSVMAKTAWFRAHRYREFPRAEDHELWLRACATSVFHQIPEPLLFYRDEHADNRFKYRMTCQGDRVILRTYGRSIVGRWRTWLLLGQSVAKSCEYSARAALARRSLPVVRRKGRLTEEYEREFAASMRRIAGTAVPGLQ